MTQTEIEKYQILLRNFTSKEKYVPGWIKSPVWYTSTKNIATNMYCIVQTPLVLPDAPPPPNNKIDKIWPLMPNIQPQYVFANTIKTLVKSWPTRVTKTKKEGTCDACNGKKEVEFTFCHEGKEWDITDVCPVCDGRGTKVVGYEETLTTDHTKYVQIGHLFFSHDRVSEMHYIAEVMEVELITIYHVGKIVGISYGNDVLAGFSPLLISESEKKEDVVFYIPITPL